MNTLSSLLKFIANTIGANPTTLKTTSKTLVGAINEMASLVYPVGCYFWTSDGTLNPATAFGGTWELMDEGLVLVSAGAGYPITAGTQKDGGNKDLVVPYHNHSISAQSISGGAHTHPVLYRNDGGSGGARDRLGQTSDYHGSRGGAATSTTHSHTLAAHNTNYAGTSGNLTNGNMQPYKNAYCWHRTA